MWDGFFDPEFILKGLGIQNLTGTIIDLGCGYGTFTILVAQANQGTVVALDIEKEMVVATQKKADQAGLVNIHTVQRDFFDSGNRFSRGQLRICYAFQHPARRGTLEDSGRCPPNSGARRKGRGHSLDSRWHNAARPISEYSPYTQTMP